MKFVLFYCLGLGLDKTKTKTHTPRPRPRPRQYPRDQDQDSNHRDQDQNQDSNHRDQDQDQGSSPRDQDLDQDSKRCLETVSRRDSVSRRPITERGDPKLRYKYTEGANKDGNTGLKIYLLSTFESKSTN